MFCKKCGKQLENEATFCGNCGTKVANDKEEVKEDKKRWNKLKKVSIITVLILILVIGLAFWKTNSNNGTVNKEVSKTLNDNTSNSEKNVLVSGNTNSNTVNGSLATIYNDEIYFRQYDKSTSKNTLYKMNKDGTGVTVALDDVGSNVNIVDEWAYYTKNDGDGWCVEKVKLDGTEKKVLNKDTSNKSYYGNLCVVNGWIYYICTREKAAGCTIEKMKLDGSSAGSLIAGNIITTSTEEEYTDLNVAEDGIYYIKYTASYDEKNNWKKTISSDFKICKADLDGKNEKEVINLSGSLDIITELVVDGKDIYYGKRNDKDYSMYWLENGDPKAQVYLEKGYGFNIGGDGYLYYIGDNNNMLEKINPKKPNDRKAVDENFSANSINIVDDWIFYFDGRHLANGKMKTDGTKIND